MSTRKSTTRATQDKQDMFSGASAVSDLVSQQVTVATQTISSMLNAVQSLQEMQQGMVARALERHTQAAEQLRQSKTPLDVLLVQADLLNFSIQEATQFWTQMAGAGASTTRQATNTATSAAAEAVPAATAVVPGLDTMMQAWQSMLSSSLNGKNPHKAG